MPEVRKADAPEGNIEAQEEWLLANAQNPAISIQAFGAVLNQLRAAGQADRADSGAELLIEAAAARKDAAALAALLGLQAAWHAEDPSFRATCARHLIACYKNDRATLALIPHAGFNKNMAVAECLRRFAILRRLRPGALCYEKTWGFGAVAELDAYAHQVVIDFEKKKAHRMALAYAAETLDLLDEDHLLARRHRDPRAFADWLDQDPAGAVICALRSFGPMSPARLQELIGGLLASAEAWKVFWNAARKKLKQNPLVEFPAKRTDPLRLLAQAKVYDGAWLATLAAERDFDGILSLVEEIKAAPAADAANGKLRETVEDRLAFVVLGTSKQNWGQAAQALMLGREMGVAWRRPEIRDYAAQLVQEAIFLETLRTLPARRLKSFLAFARETAGDSALDLFIRLLPEMASSALGETIAYLQAAGRMPQVLETMRGLIGSGRASCEIVYWLCRREDLAESNGISTAGKLAMEALAVLEARDAAGERLKAKHQLRALFEQPAWLKKALESMSTAQRNDFMRRLKDTTAWDAIDRRAILARVLKLHPELSAMLQADAAAAPASAAARITSLRSYRERQKLLTRIVAQDIPKNSRDIAVARAFGDLRENFEYKSAKETQGILLQRKAELETQLAEVKGTDFEGFPSVVAGPGTRVILRRPDGKTDTYYILGEWDSDESRGILSSRCKVGQAVAGRRPGDTVSIPTATGHIACTLLEVGELPPEIKAWIRANA